MDLRQEVVLIAFLGFCSVMLALGGAYVLWAEHVHPTPRSDGFYAVAVLCTNIAKGMVAVGAIGLAAAVWWTVSLIRRWPRRR